MLLTVLRENKESADRDFKDLGGRNGGRRQVAGAVFNQGARVTHGEHQRSGLQHQHPERHVLDPVRVRRGRRHDGGGGLQLQGSRRGLQEGREEKDKAIKDGQRKEIGEGQTTKSFRKIKLCPLFSIKTISAIPQLASIFIIKPHKEESSLLTCSFFPLCYTWKVNHFMCESITGKMIKTLRVWVTHPWQITRSLRLTRLLANRSLLYLQDN